MKDKRKYITLQCDCKCCMLVIEKIKCEDGEINYNISIQDSRYNRNFNSFAGRIKRAWSILFGKPIYYNDLYMDSEETFKTLLDDMKNLFESEL